MAGGKPASFLDFGPDGGASLPGLPRTASGGAPSMMSELPADRAGGLMDGIGGDRPLSVGTLGAGNGGSFVSGLSALASGGGGGGAGAELEEEDHRAVFAKIFEEVKRLALVFGLTILGAWWCAPVTVVLVWAAAAAVVLVVVLGVFSLASKRSMLSAGLASVPGQQRAGLSSPSTSTNIRSTSCARAHLCCRLLCFDFSSACHRRESNVLVSFSAVMRASRARRACHALVPV